MLVADSAVVMAVVMAVAVSGAGIRAVRAGRFGAGAGPPRGRDVGRAAQPAHPGDEGPAPVRGAPALHGALSGGSARARTGQR